MSSSESLSKLLKRSTIIDDQEVLNSAENILKTSKDDINALHFKIVALVKLDRYDEVLKVLENVEAPLKEKVKLEHAYALYKAGKLSEAIELASQGNDRGSKHVEAQARYRIEDLAAASNIYQSLRAGKGNAVGEDDDLRINAGAIDAQLEWAQLGHLTRARKASRQDLEVFESAYNAACGSIARGELSQANVLLKRAKDLCTTSTELTEEARNAELLAISVQQIYVLNRLGKKDEARQLQGQVELSRIPDPTLRSIAVVNKTVTEKCKNPFIIQRLSQQTKKHTKVEKSFSYQATAIKNNKYATRLQAQQFDGVDRSSFKARKQANTSSTRPDIALASAYGAAAKIRDGDGPEALDLDAVKDNHKSISRDAGLQLLVVQLFILLGKKDLATSHFEKYLGHLTVNESVSKTDRYQPGLVAVMTALYSSRGQESQVRGELSTAAQTWLKEIKTSPDSLTPAIINLLSLAGSKLTSSTVSVDRELAHEIFSTLQSSSSLASKYIDAGYIASSTSSNNALIQSSNLDTSSLTAIDRLTSSISATNLEEAGVPKPQHSAPSTSDPQSKKRPATTQPSHTAQEPAAKKQKHIKPSKLPKDYDGTKTPDPERWLPLRDRSTYKPSKSKKGTKGKAKEKNSREAAQGAIMDTEPTSNKPEATTVITASGNKDGGKGSSGKKKGKGKKW